MAKISIDVEALSKNAGNLNQQYQTLKSLNEKLEQLIAEISADWQGNASEAYVRMMRDYLVQGRNMEGVLLEFKKYADNTASQFSNCDRESANRIYRSF